LRLLDDGIKKVEADLIAARGPTTAPVELEADLAALRAERQAVAREEPELAGAIADLEPNIAGLKASRAELEARRDELIEVEREAQIRIQEKVAAIRARKAVDDREVADVARERNSALRELGEMLHEERLPLVAPRLRGVDQHDEAIATLERRAIELKDKMLRVDRRAMWRGFAFILVLAVLIGGSASALLLLLQS
jgi:chromosome segregation ATPase